MGARAVIGPGITVGGFAMVGIGSVVDRTCPTPPFRSAGLCQCCRCLGCGPPVHGLVTALTRG